MVEDNDPAYSSFYYGKSGNYRSLKESPSGHQNFVLLIICNLIPSSVTEVRNQGSVSQMTEVVKQNSSGVNVAFPSLVLFSASSLDHLPQRVKMEERHSPVGWWDYNRHTRCQAAASLLIPTDPHLWFSNSRERLNSQKFSILPLRWGKKFVLPSLKRIVRLHLPLCPLSSFTSAPSVDSYTKITCGWAARWT